MLISFQEVGIERESARSRGMIFPESSTANDCSASRTAGRPIHTNRPLRTVRLAEVNGRCVQVADLGAAIRLKFSLPRARTHTSASLLTLTLWGRFGRFDPFQLFGFPGNRHSTLRLLGATPHHHHSSRLDCSKTSPSTKRQGIRRRCRWCLLSSLARPCGQAMRLDAA